MYKVVPLKTLSKITVTENNNNPVTVVLIDTNITLTKPINLVNITNCGS